MSVIANDIVHFYLGSKFRFTYKDGDVIEAVLEVINDSGFICGTVLYPKGESANDWFEIENFRKDGELQLILKDPTEMTDWEKAEYKRLCKRIKDTDGKTVYLADTPLSLKYLFVHHIDAFDLIENGQAIHERDQLQQDGIFKTVDKINTLIADIAEVEKMFDVNEKSNWLAG